MLSITLVILICLIHAPNIPIINIEVMKYMSAIVHIPQVFVRHLGIIAAENKQRRKLRELLTAETN